MRIKSEPSPRLLPVGEFGLLIDWGDTVSSLIYDQVRALDVSLEAHSLDGIMERVPAYASLLLIYDPLVLHQSELIAHINEHLSEIQIKSDHNIRQIEIPVQYGGDYGPDLMSVAAHTGFSESEVVERHVSGFYRVGMMGFMPGFAYLLGLDSELETPRLKSPRTNIPAGSIGIAGQQTGIYPLDSPGGWQIIGRTTVKLFDPLSDTPFLLAPGDIVRFVESDDGSPT